MLVWVGTKDDDHDGNSDHYHDNDDHLAWEMPFWLAQMMMIMMTIVIMITITTII